MTGQNRRLRRAMSRLSRKPATREAPVPSNAPEPARTPGAHVSLRSHAPHLYPDRALLEAFADPQRGSPFLSALPAEVRQLVYAFMWRSGPHVHGIHIDHDRRADRLTSGPCMLGREDIWTAADVNGALDDGFAAESLGEPGWRPNIDLSARQYGKLGWKMGVSHRRCGDEAVDGARNAARFRTGGDPRALWSPFLPVLLICKRVYLEAVDTIFTTLPPVFPINDPNPAHLFLSQDPHPSTHHLQTVSLFVDDHPAAAQVQGHGWHADFFPPVPGPAGPPSALWPCTFAALSRLPALREVRLALCFNPDAEWYDLRALARWAGRDLAAQFVVDLPRQDRGAPCRDCGAPPGGFILPPGNGGSVDGDGGDCPPFGTVTWHERLRYTINGGRGVSVQHYSARALDQGLCSRCNL